MDDGGGGGGGARYSVVLAYHCALCDAPTREEVLLSFALLPLTCPTCRFIARQARENGLAFARDAVQINTPYQHPAAGE